MCVCHVLHQIAFKTNLRVFNKIIFFLFLWILKYILVAFICAVLTFVSRLVVTVRTVVNFSFRFVLLHVSLKKNRKFVDFRLRGGTYVRRDFDCSLQKNRNIFKLNQYLASFKLASRI